MKEKIKVAIVDTGIEKNHEYLKDNIVGGISFQLDGEYIVLSDEYEDENGHGTLCASTIKKEFENVEIFVVKALDKLGRANIQILEESLKYLLSIDIHIINLSLSVMESEKVKDLYKICEELSNQNKIIVCSVANGFEWSYPAKFKNVIGVKGFILEDENTFWYNKDFDIQCIMDNNSYLRCDLNNSYRLFGKCNSQAAAKVTGKIANIIYENANLKLGDLNEKLEELAMRNQWTSNDLKESKRFPQIKKNNKKSNDEILKNVEKILENILNLDIKHNELYEFSLFNRYIGLNSANCFKVIKKLEEIFCINLDYMNISRYDFVSIYTLADLVERNLNNKEMI